MVYVMKSLVRVLKVKYFTSVQNVVRNCKLFVFPSRCFFRNVTVPPESYDEMLASC